jgi:hypothetical protein
MSHESMMITNNLYAEDYNLWLEKTASLLKNKNFAELDLENLVEEIESMGRNEKNAVKSNLRVLIMHLLKYKVQPQNRSNSWLYTIYEHRQRLKDTF